ncbi:MAG: hypothetical protein LM576_05270 [Thermofilum sp.]|nr:hypothetical protein [Thermofilum sp.]
MARWLKYLKCVPLLIIYSATFTLAVFATSYAIESFYLLISTGTLTALLNLLFALFLMAVAGALAFAALIAILWCTGQVG